jgi:hypothetical protein
MIPASIARAIPALLVLAAAIWVVQNYWWVFVLLVAVFLFGRYVGPKLPPYLGGNTPAKMVEVGADLEWELYLAISTRNVALAKQLLQKGADPHKTFRTRPAITNAKNCYAFVSADPSLLEYKMLFDRAK